MHKVQEKTLPEIRREKQLEAAVVVSFLTIWISNFTLLQKKKKLPYLLKRGTYMYLNQIPQKGIFLRELRFGLMETGFP